MPEIVDSHAHPLPSKLAAGGVDLTDARTLAEIRAGIAAERARCQPGEWILGWGLDYNAFEHAGIHGSLIAEAAGGAPALIRFMDFHVMDGDLSTLDLLRELEANGDLAIRLLTPYWIQPDMEPGDWARFAAHRDAHGRRWRAGVAKLFIDGVIDSGTGWLSEPDGEGAGVAPFWEDPARYREAVAFFADHGFQCVTHATGDRGVREALDAYATVARPIRGFHRVEHIETLQPQDLPRFAAQRVVASMQAQHMMWLAPDRSDNWSRRLGPERCDRAFPIRSLLASGAMLTLGSDWPVARFDPREGMAAARLRRPPGLRDRAPYDDQAISALDALHGYTTWPARTVGHDDVQGVIRPGAWADLTVFATDPVACDADDLPQNPVRLTVVDGEVVYRDADL